mmetsp:Transcript_39516/g.88423  ORF Transcript_39516/g.88423 Transcript_39516/m.88423 type:complete len:85 (-) Transcript_39516:54-308(-)
MEQKKKDGASRAIGSRFFRVIGKADWGWWWCVGGRGQRKPRQNKTPCLTQPGPTAHAPAASRGIYLEKRAVIRVACYRPFARSY